MGKRYLIITTALVSVSAHAADLAFPDRGRAAVVDAAHILPAPFVADLNRRIVAWDNATKHQLAIATVPSLQGREIADYGYQMGRAWGLGRKGIDDGILFLIAPAEHKVRIEVGRGLEGDMTDADTSVILSDTVVPKLKAGDMSGAVSDGADAIMQAVPANAGDLANAPKSGGSHLLAWLIGLCILIIGSGAAAFAVISRRQKKQMDEMAERHRLMRERVERDISSGARPSAPRYSAPPSAPRSSSPSRQSTTVAPVIINDSFNSSSSSSSYDSGSSSSSDWGSSSSSDWGSSGFDSGGGSFSGGGSDSSW